MALNTGRAGGGWKDFSQEPSAQEKPVVAPDPIIGGDRKMAPQAANQFSTWSKEKQDEYISGRRELLAMVEENGFPLSPYFQSLKEGIAAVDKGEKTWNQVYTETVGVGAQAQGPAGTRGQQAAASVPGAPSRQGIDLSGIRGNDNSLAVQEDFYSR